jgi:hypothetical protein
MSFMGEFSGWKRQLAADGMAARTFNQIQERLLMGIPNHQRHSGAMRSIEPGIHTHDRGYGFRACAKLRIPE